MNPLGVHHVAIKTRRVARLAQFYAEVMRLEEFQRNVDEQGLRSVWLRTGPAIVMIERSASTPGPTPAADDPPGLHLLAFRITPAQVPGWRTHLETHGIAVTEETSFTLYLRDPEHNRIGLSSWPDPLAS